MVCKFIGHLLYCCSGKKKVSMMRAMIAGAFPLCNCFAWSRDSSHEISTIVSPYTNLPLSYTSSPLSSFGLCITYFFLLLCPKYFLERRFREAVRDPVLGKRGAGL